MTIQTFNANELYYPESLQDCVSSTGHLEVPAGHDGYVIYGPYITVAEGFYKVSITIEQESTEIGIGDFEVFSRGHIYLSAEITQSNEFLIHLPSLKELEFRIRSRGVPFTFQKIELEKIELASLSKHSADVKIGDHIWQGFHKSAPLEVLERLAAFASADVSCSNSFIRSIPAWDDDRIIASSDQLAAAGFNLDAIRTISADTFEAEAELASECGFDSLPKLLHEFGAVGTRPIGDAFLDALAKRSGAFQVTLAKEGIVFCRCPFTSIALQSKHGFAVAVDELKQSYLFYYFKGIEPFYLVAAGFGGRKTFLYFPLTDVVVQLGDPAHDWGNHSLAIESLKRLTIRNLRNVTRYLSQPTSRCLLGGSLDNLGHFIWNDLNGLIRFEQQDLLREVNQAVSYRFSFLQPETVLESTSDLSVTKVKSSDQLFRFMTENCLLPLRPTSLILDANITDRIVSAAQRVLSAAEEAEIQKAKLWGDIVWFNLRLHNKSYIEQVEAAHLLIERAHLERKRIVLFMDGMRDCQSLLQPIIDAAGDTVRVVDGTTKSMQESIAWAAACKTYVATIGSGLTLVTWLAGKPGVAHSEKAHLSQLEFWPLVRHDIPVPKAPPSDAITDIGSGAYCNYSINPQLICDLVWPLIEAPEMVSGEG